MRVHFVSGLKPEIRRLVESKFSSLKTKEELIKAAVEAEVAPEEEVRGRPPGLLVDRPTSRGLATGTHG